MTSEMQKPSERLSEWKNWVVCAIAEGRGIPGKEEMKKKREEEEEMKKEEVDEQRE